MPDETTTRPDSMQEWARKALLFDFYAPLLTEKQCCIWDNYYQMDLSMAEIARQQNTSRQAVHALLKRTEESLEFYEEKMGLIEHFLVGKDLLLQVDKRMESLLTDTDIVTDAETDTETDTEGNCERKGHLSPKERFSRDVAEMRTLIQRVLDTY